MRTLLALAALSLVAYAAPSRTPAVPPFDAEFVAAVCEGDGLPFALPSAAVTEDWADSEFETWSEGAWSDYCAKASSPEAKAVCACTGH